MGSQAVVDAAKTNPRAGECGLGLKANPRILNGHAQAGSVDTGHDSCIASVLGRRDAVFDGILDERLEEQRQRHPFATDFNEWRVSHNQRQDLSPGGHLDRLPTIR